MISNSIKPSLNKVFLSDFNKRIKIQTSFIKANNAPNTKATASFETIAQAWALIKTNTNNQFINGVNIVSGLNIDFYIKHQSKIDYEKQLWVEFKDNLFKITQIDNIDKDNNIVRLRASETGNKNILANQR